MSRLPGSDAVADRPDRARRLCRSMVLLILAAVVALSPATLAAQVGNEAPPGANSNTGEPVTEPPEGAAGEVPRETALRAGTDRILQPTPQYLADTCKFSLAGFADFDTVSSLAGCGNHIQLSQQVIKYTVEPGGWSTWADPPQVESSTPEVLHTPAASNTLTLDQPVSVIGFEVEPNHWEVHTVFVDYYNEVGELLASIAQDIDGEAGARLMAIQRSQGDIKQVVVSIPGEGDGFALAQIRISALAPLVVFVEGVTSKESCSDPSSKVLALFDYIKTLPGFAEADFRVFSYRPSGSNPDSAAAYPACAWAEDYGWDSWPNYTKGSTCSSIDDDAAWGHSHRFLEWLKEVSKSYDEVYVLAHSMGGTVVAYALAEWGLPAKVKAVVTLDSPLAGQPFAEAHAGLSLFSCSPSAGAYADLDPGWPGDPSAVVTAIQNDMSLRRRLLVTAIGNNEDLAVWASHSHLPGAWLNLRIDKGCSGLGDHFCVFTEARALEGVRQSLLNPYLGTSRNPPGMGTCDGEPANVVGSPTSDDINFPEPDDLGIGDENDMLFGSPWKDVIVGLGGMDEIVGLSGNDVICGGDGMDTLSGEVGNDRLFGEGSADALYGGGGADYLHGGPGLDLFFGGAGSDTCVTVGLEIPVGC